MTPKCLLDPFQQRQGGQESAHASRPLDLLRGPQGMDLGPLAARRGLLGVGLERRWAIRTRMIHRCGPIWRPGRGALSFGSLAPFNLQPPLPVRGHGRSDARVDLVRAVGRGPDVEVEHRRGQVDGRAGVRDVDDPREAAFDRRRTQEQIGLLR